MPAEDGRHSEITRRQHSRTDTKQESTTELENTTSVDATDTDEIRTPSDREGRPTSADDLSGNQFPQSATARGETLAADLVGLPRVELGEFVYDHQLPNPAAGEQSRQVALFDVENTGSRPLRWQAAKTKFIGDDQYTYRPAQLSLDPSKLGPGCHTRQVVIEPGRRARFVTLVEELPEGVEVVEIIQKVPGRGARESQRVEFNVA